MLYYFYKKFIKCDFLASVRFCLFIEIIHGRIGDGSFEKCSSLENILLEKAIKKIRGCAFFYCSKLNNFLISSSNKLVDGGAFGVCSNLSRNVFAFNIGISQRL